MEHLEDVSSLVWLCVVVFTAFSELLFLQYRLLWVSVGADAGLVLSLLDCPLWLQISVFVSVVCLLLWLTRKISRLGRCDIYLRDLIRERTFENDSIRFDRDVGNFDENGSGPSSV